MTKDYTKIVYEKVEGNIARISLNSPSNRNAQDLNMTYELNDALMRAAHDDEVRVIILSGEGKHFSSGHDLTLVAKEAFSPDREITGTWADRSTSTVEGWYGWEQEIYLGMCRRWRAIPKPTIAQVQGGCIAGGLMLAWVCDLIIASDDAFFQDPVVDLGVGGVEYFAHVWEIGSRRAKEKLFTADRWSAQDALEWGMVNRVVARENLPEETLTLARRIASKPTFSVKMVKRAVNAALDNQGFSQTLEHAFDLHHLGHAHNWLKYNTVIDPNGVAAPIRRSLPGEKLPEMDTLRVAQP